MSRQHPVTHVHERASRPGARRNCLLTLLLALLLLATSPTLQAAAPSLGSYNVDTDQISVSGLSAGGFMASQVHVAHSATFMGAGLVAGGVYYCAEGSLSNATGRCMDSGWLPSGSYFADIARDAAGRGDIDPVANMSGDRVWIFTGSNDTVVRTESSDRARDFYEQFTDSANITYSRNQLGAGHGQPTLDYGNPCSSETDPYINNCNYDAAGRTLQHIYGSLNAPAGMIDSNLQEFDQSSFTSSFYIGSTGYVYVPDACADGVQCRLHVVLHGCKQNRDDIGDEFARHTGYNEWAEANNIIVVYPQTSAYATNSCWDWWGYESSAYHLQSGPQIQFIKAVVDHIAAGSDGGGGGGGGDGGSDFQCQDWYTTNNWHEYYGRAYYSGGYYTEGGNDYLGSLSGTYTWVKETASGYFEAGQCP